VNAAADEPKPVEPPKEANTPKVAVEKSNFRAMVEQEVRKTGLPADVADAVVQVESNYDPSVIGGVGEIFLMQIRPGRRRCWGSGAALRKLAKPEINIQYGVGYLSKAWRLANGDLCRTLMKYRAGHGQEVMTPRSVKYCNRARNHLAALGTPMRPEDRRRLLSSRFQRLRTNQPKALLISPKEVDDCLKPISSNRAAIWNGA